MFDTVESEETDILKIKSNLLKDFISKKLKEILKKKFGHDINIIINEAEAVTNHGKAHIHLNIDVEIADWIKILLNKN